MIARTITQNLITDCDNKKAVVVIGPRQVGKTTLIQKIVEELKEESNK